jgi:hypothetical protein
MPNASRLTASNNATIFFISVVTPLIQVSVDR